MKERTQLIEVVEGSGRERDSYINLDNAATTPVAVSVAQAVLGFLGVYGSVHRGSGLKSLISTELYEAALERIRRFVGATDNDVVVLAPNTTTAINRLAACYGFGPDDVVLISEIEHSSNELPWRSHARVERFRATAEGRLDLDDLEDSLTNLGGHVRLVAVTGASNVTGYLPPVDDVARLAHAHGAEVFVDAAQLAPHRPIRLSGGEEETRADFVAFSGHKMYAPFGVGTVVGPARPFRRRPPDIPGGGTVDMVTPDEVLWADLPASATPGTPNVVGLVALAAAIEMIETLGYERIRAHEKRLLATGMSALRSCSELVLYGYQDYDTAEDRLPIFPFSVGNLPHGLLAAVLGREHNIAVRHGHLCQYEFMRRQLGVTPEEQRKIVSSIGRSDRREMYGMVRASCGLCTSEADLEALGDALRAVSANGPLLSYEADTVTGHFAALDEADGVRAAVPDDLQFLLGD